MDLPWCTYRTAHPSGLFYHGKGRTALVLAGKYNGSGVRFNLALTWEGYEPQTWTTTVLATYATEDEAYQAEEELVCHESLANPFCLNMMAGGRKGKYKTPSTLLRRFRMEQKRARASARRAAQQEKLAALKRKAKEDKLAAAAKLKAAKALAR